MSDEKLDAARVQLHDALQAMSDILAPRACPHGDYAQCDVCEYDDTFIMEDGAMLSEFVLVMSWTTLADGENFVGIQTPPKQLLTHTNGLLFTALYE